MRKSKPITITLGSQRKSLEDRIQSGDYESASEVVRAALRALDREEAALDEIMKAKISEALDDPRPPIPESDVFERLEQRFERLRAGG
jgi:antitoxin ParD1/3/4